MARIFRDLIVFFLFSAFLVVVSASSRADTIYGEQPWIRVALSYRRQSVSVSATSGSRITYAATSQVVGSNDQSRSYAFHYSGGRVVYDATGDIQSAGFSIACADDAGRLRHNGNSYRRVIRIVPWDGGLACVNVLPMEEYILGVVPCEVPHTWPEESLKAQAVAARTYSYRAIGQYPERPFDVYSSVIDQLYRGAGSERERTTSACRDTSGEICTFNGEPIIAYFHSCAGGWTASGAEMFGRDLPYLKPVPSRDLAVHRWTYTISTGNLESSLRRAGYGVGSIQRIWVHRFSPEGRAEEIKIVHTGGVLLISGADLRKILGPGNIESTYFTLEGQMAPDIPEEDQSSPTRSVNPVERYALVHPDILVSLPVTSHLDQCRIIAADGIYQPDNLAVIGAEDSREYLGGYIWIATPARAGELDNETVDSAAHSAFEPIDIPPIEEIDDPGDDVGIPRNGTVVFVGHGCGHGVGMSQHGARILAENGWTYDRILTWFYSGIEIERAW